MIFANPMFLWGLLALAIPVVVHLFQFRRYKKVWFSNVDRLSELQSESRRQSTLRRWLVLVLRCLALLFLVLAFAQPSLSGGERTLRSGSTVVSVYLDNSFSMDNGTSDGTLLEAAKQKAREIAAAYRPGDRYQLLTGALGGDEFRWLSREEFLDAVDAVTVGPASRRLSEVAVRQSDFMRQSGAANRHAYLVSDFQRSVADLSALPSDSLVLFTLVPLEGIAADNIYIDTLRLDAPAYFVGGTVAVEATVVNASDSPVEKLPVKLLIGGRERALATLDIPAGGTAKASLLFTIDSAGWIDGSVELTDYPITFDDHYFFTLLAGSPIQMLEAGAGADSPIAKLFSSDSSVVYRQGLLPSDLSPYNFIVLNGLREMPSAAVAALTDWVEQGGSLLIAPPPDGRVEALGSLLAQLQAPRLDRWVRRAVKASAVDAASSLYRGVFSATTDEMEMPSVQGHWLLGGQGAVGQNVITLADGTPFLSLTPCGEGRLYLFSSPLTTEWTDFPQQALFVPTLYNMALYSRPQPAVAHSLAGGEPVIFQGSYDPAGAPPSLRSADGAVSFLPDIRRLGSRSVLVPHGFLTLGGHYLLGEGEHLVFNYPRSESELVFLSRDEIERFTHVAPGVTLVRGGSKPLDGEALSLGGGIPLWRWCLLAALLALFVESLLLRLCSSKLKK